MKKILMILVVCILAGCQQTTIKPKLERVDKSVLNQYDFDKPDKEGGYVYSISNDDYMYIVFENMGIDPAQVKLELDDDVVTIDIGNVKQNDKKQRYVFKYTYVDDTTLIITDGKKQYPFATTYIADN